VANGYRWTNGLGNIKSAVAGRPARGPVTQNGAHEKTALNPADLPPGRIAEHGWGTNQGREDMASMM